MILGGAEGIILVVSSIASLLVALSVYSKNPKSTTNIIFGFLISSLIGWSFANYFSLRANTDESSFILIKIIFSFVILQHTLFLLFAVVFPSTKRLKMSLYNIAYALFSVTVISLIIADLVVLRFENGNLVPGPGIALFTLHALVSIIGGFYYLIRKKSDIDNKVKRFLLYASALLWVVVPVTNFILPAVFNFTFFVRLSPLYILLFNVIISYAIVRHKLFDIRSTVARALAYLSSIGSMLLIYLLVIFALSGTEIVAKNLNTLQRLSFATVAVLSGLLFPPFKKFFDRITNKIFFQDAYDSQVLIDELNQALVTNVELESLLTKAALVIQENLKASYCTFYIRETSYFPDRIIGAHRRDPEYDNVEKMQEYAAKLKTKVFSAESDPGNENENNLQQSLKKNDIEIIARLVDTLDYEVKGIGYIFIGAKRSGSLYTANDQKVIEIIANELVIAVENVLRFEEIEEFNVTLQKKIDTATRELKQSNDKLKALDEAKDEFVSMASHQLRTPLTSIKGYISMVMEGDAGKINETQEKMLGQAFFSSQRMVYLISDLLNVSRLKTGKFLIESKPVYLPDVVESELEQLQEGAKVKDISLSFTKPKKFATLTLDEMKTRQVIMNFADNALHYTPSGGKISVELRETPKSVEFSVKDTGIGVPKEQRPKLFTKFYRADNARKARPDGTGLGLFMAKKVIIAQGGSVIFDSKEGKGSTFGFSFPKEKLEVDKPT